MKTDRPRTSPGPAPGKPEPKSEPASQILPEMEAPSRRSYPSPFPPPPGNKKYVAFAHNGQVGFGEIGPGDLFAVGWFSIEQAEQFIGRIMLAINEARSQRF